MEQLVSLQPADLVHLPIEILVQIVDYLEIMMLYARLVLMGIGCIVKDPTKPLFGRRLNGSPLNHVLARQDKC